jgi:hypothetical protein
MAKGAGRKASEKGSSVVPGGSGARVGGLSPEEAERAAEAFVPLWQLDEAPFAASSNVTDADLRALAGPLTASAALQLAPPPVIGAAVPPVESAVTQPMAVELLQPQDAAPPTMDADLMSRATIRMAPPVTLHQPIPRRPTEPDLPSVIVEESEPALPASPVDVDRQMETVPIRSDQVAAHVASQLASQVTIPMATVSPAKVAAAFAQASPAAREPKTDPPSRPARAPRTGRPSGDVAQAPVAAYQLPRNRSSLMVIGGVVGSAVLLLAVYFVSNAMSAPEPSTAATAPTSASPAHGRGSETTSPGPNIPPPPPVDETPATVTTAASPSPTPVAPPKAVAPTAALPPASPPRPAPPPAAPPPVAAAPPSTKWMPSPPTPRPARPTPPPAAKNPSTSPASGGIVRDNPF